MEEEKWEKVVDNIDAEEWDFSKNKELVGVFLSKKENVGPNNSNIYYIENKKGTFSFWGKTMLDILLAKIEVGEEVKITFTGMKTPKKGGKDYFNYEVSHRKSPFAKVDTDTKDDIPELGNEKDEINLKDIPFK